MNKLLILIFITCGVGGYYYITTPEPVVPATSQTTEDILREQREAAYRNSSPYQQTETNDKSTASAPAYQGNQLDPDSFAAMKQQAEQMVKEANARMQQQTELMDRENQARMDQQERHVQETRNTINPNGYTRQDYYDDKQLEELRKEKQERRKLDNEIQMRNRLISSKYARKRYGIRSSQPSNMDVCYAMYKADQKETAACFKRLSSIR